MIQKKKNAVKELQAEQAKGKTGGKYLNIIMMEISHAKR